MVGKDLYWINEFFVKELLLSQTTSLGLTECMLYRRLR